MPENGKLAPSELAAIPGGRLAKPAARAWNAAGGPAEAGCLPTGPESTYRDLAGQEKQRHEWCAKGLCGNAAVPGTSNHGLGICVDLKEPWMRAWIDEHGRPYGWAKTEAFQEWWHVNFTGEVTIDLFDTLRKGDRGKRVLWYTRRLAYVHEPGGKAYLKKKHPPRKFGRRVEEAVEAFQVDHHLEVDGEIGPRTAALIAASFRRQYQARHHKPRRGTHSAAASSAIKAPAAETTRPVWKPSYAARFIGKWEGYLDHAYLDTIAEPDVWTGGYGHTGSDVKPGMHVSRALAMRWLISDIRSAARGVKRNIHVPLTIRQRIALISLAFNCGPGAVEGSTLQSLLNARHYEAAADEFLKWSHAGGVVVEGLLNRRKEERWLFLHDGRKH